MQSPNVRFNPNTIDHGWFTGLECVAYCSVDSNRDLAAIADGLAKRNRASNQYGSGKESGKLGHLHFDL